MKKISLKIIVESIYNFNLYKLVNPVFIFIPKILKLLCVILFFIGVLFMLNVIFNA